MSPPEEEVAAPPASGNGDEMGNQRTPQQYSSDCPLAIEIGLIQVDRDLQMREAGVDPGTVAEYAEAMAAGATFPPVTVYFDGEAYWLADGFHRVEAARLNGAETIVANIREGTRRHATLTAVAANASHGLRRTSADKRRAVARLLSDPEWANWSSRQIALACAVDKGTVERVRSELTGENATQRTYTTRHGTTATMKVRAPEPGGSMVEKLLAKAETAALVAECRRRGLEVSGHED